MSQSERPFTQAKIPPEGIHFALIEAGRWLESILPRGRIRFFNFRRFLQ